MRILIHEYVTGGGLAGRPVPLSLAREGAAMLAAIVADLAAIERHRLIVTADERFPPRLPASVEVVALPATVRRAGRFRELVAAADAVWLIAPETAGCLSRLTAVVEAQGRRVLGASAAAVRRASDKAQLPRRLAQVGVSHPRSEVLRTHGDARSVARALGYPVVVKPGRGAGCEGVHLARTPSEVERAVTAARRVAGRGPVLVQAYVKGTAASVSLVADGASAVALAVNGQTVCGTTALSYLGGRTPLDHPLAGAAADAAVRACQAFPGLRGYIGVDLVLAREGPVVIEVNPRLTTAYLGVRAALGVNVASLVLAACGGKLPAASPARRRVRFTASGRVVGVPSMPHVSRKR